MMIRNNTWLCVVLMIGSGCGSSATSTGGTPSTENAPVAPAGMVAAQPAPSASAMSRAAAPRATAVSGMSQAGAASVAPAAGSGGAADAGSAPAAATSSSLPTVSDFSMNGPYEAITMPGTGPNNNYTVFYPEDLAPNSAKNPIVGWMSGGGTDPSLYPLLPLLATHGFVVVASNTIPGIGDEASLGREIIAGIDWALAENARDGSMFYQKLDSTRLASVGYSMGSLATFQIAGDARLTTTVHISGGNMTPEPIHNLHAPAAFFCGIPGDDSCNILSDSCDIAAANCDKDFAAASTPVFYANFSSGHLGILTPPFQEQIQTEVVAWLRWQLLGDAAIKPRFVGEQCGVCEDQRWKVQQKGLN